MKYDLVFEGGGAKGMVFVGAYEEFVRRGHTFGRLLGTSAGAITGVLIAAGYSPNEMMDALTEKENGKPVFAGFMGEPLPFTQQEIRSSAIREFLRNINFKFIPDFIEEKLDDEIACALAKGERFRHVFSFVERGGWFSAERFVVWLRTKLDSGAPKGIQRKFSNMTLKEFYNSTRVDFSVVASDTSDNRLLVLNHQTAPGCPVVQAVRMSMSIPLLWDEVVWDGMWGRYRGMDIQGHTVVDGGLLSNFPLELFTSDEPQVIQLMGPKQNNPVMGWLIDETLPVPPKGRTRGILVEANVKVEELRVVQRLRDLMNSATTAHDKMVIDAYQHLVVRMPAQGYGTTEFDMTDERRVALVEAGRNAMAEYFDQLPVGVAAPRAFARTPIVQSRETADRIAMRILGLQAPAPSKRRTRPLSHARRLRNVRADRRKQTKAKRR